MSPTSTQQMDRIRERLRRVALLTAPVTLALLLSTPAAALRVGSVAAVLALAVLWGTAHRRETWSAGEATIEAVLLLALTVTAGDPSITLAAFYGGLTYRSFGNGRPVALRAFSIYAAAYLLGVLASQSLAGRLLLHDLIAGLPGFALSTFVASTLSIALRAEHTATAQLRQLDERFRLLLENASEGMAVLDSERRILFANASLEAMLGFGDGELVGRSAAGLITDEDHAFTERPLAELPAEGHPLIELTARRKDGGAALVEVSSSALGDGTILATVRDTTARRATELALRQSEEQFRHVVETAHEGVWLMDISGTTTYVNARLAEMLGYAADEMIGRPVFSFMPTERATAARLHFAQEQSSVAELHEWPFLNRAGGVVWTWCSSSPMLSDSGEFHGVLAMVTDITNGIRAEAELKEAHAILAGIVEAAPVGIVTIDSSTNVKTWNPEAARIFGWLADDVIGRRLPIVPPEREEEFARFRHLESDGKALRDIETTRLRRDGTRVDVHLSTASLRGADGEIVGTVGLFMDLSDRKALEAQLIQSQKMEAVGQLAGGIAHDFNNIITAIKGNASFLLEGCAQCGAVPVEAADIDRAANRAASLTSQLLAFSRRQVIRPELVNVARLVSDSDSMLRRLVPESIRLETMVESPDISVTADAGQLGRVIMNLVLNSRDAMPDGGQLWIRVRGTTLGPADSQRVGGAAITAGPYIEISVMDSGCGMDASVRQHAFEPFFTTKPVGRGTGLGLSTVYGIVKQNNGYVSLDSSPGAGTTVSVFLPAGGPAPAAEPGPGAAEPRAGHETILFIEDEGWIYAIVERTLAANGYTVLGARDGDEALAVARAHSGAIDLLFTDVVLPIRSGPAVAEVLRRERPGLPVLYCSGYPDDLIGDAGVLAPDTDLLPKPFTPRDLLDCVRRVLDRQRVSPVRA